MALSTFTDGDNLNMDGKTWFQNNVIKNPFINPIGALIGIQKDRKELAQFKSGGASGAAQMSVSDADIQNAISQLNSPRSDSGSSGRTLDATDRTKLYKQIGVGLAITATVITLGVMAVKHFRKA